MATKPHPAPAKYRRRAVCRAVSFALLLTLTALLAGVAPGVPAHYAAPGGGWESELGPVHTVFSPDGRIAVRTELADGALYYSVARNHHRILNTSALGLEFGAGSAADRAPPGTLVIVGVGRSVGNTRWTAVWGKSRQVPDRFRELVIRLKETTAPGRELSVILRAYDDGVALRYALPEQANLAGGRVRDRTEFNFAGDWPAWNVGEGVEYPPVGPRRISDIVAANPPLLARTERGNWLALHEAALLDYAPLRLAGPRGAGEGEARKPYALRAAVEPAPFRTPLATPWRVLLIAPELGELLESRLLETLSPPSRIADTAWIQPGKAVWDWRIRGLTYGAVHYGPDTQTYMQLIDFAAKHNIAYLLIDANWYGDERDPQASPLTPAPGIAIDAVLAHANANGVKVMLYVNDVAFTHHDIDAVFATFRNWGVAGVKYGFMRGEGYAKVRKTTAAIEAAARHRLLIDFHDNPVHPTGLQRTYPNLISVEFCHAQTDALRAFTPGEYLRTVFVHMLAGPVDMSNGFFALDSIQTRTKAGPEGTQLRYPPVYATVAAETARILITDTGLSVLPDAPEEYARKDDLFEFVRRLPNAGWDETHVLHAALGRHITTARRHGMEWFIGSVVDERGGSLNIDLGFLADGVSYTATLYEDAVDSHYRNNREAYRVRTMTVDSGDRIVATMAPGGGHAVWLRPE